jgi:hypothetical protein
MSETSTRRTKIFISYSHQDSQWLERLRTHLRPLERRYGVEVWADTRIRPGSKWREEIENALSSAKIAILLVSADFIASDFVDKHELPPLLRAAEKEGTVILPLILSPSMFPLIEELSQFQAVNDPSKPLVGLSKHEQDAVYVKLAELVGAMLGPSPNIQERRERQMDEIVVPRSSPSNNPEEDDATFGGLKRHYLARIPSPVWVAIITGVVAIITAYWQFVYKPAHLQQSQTIQYTGRVMDARTNKPIHNAKVSIEENQDVPQIHLTDSEGIFHVILHGAIGVARIRVDADGYDSFDRNVSFSRTGIEPINLSSTPTSTPTPLASQPSPRHPAAPRRRPTPCTPEDILRGKCNK